MEIFIPNWRPTADNHLIGCHWAKKNRLKAADKQMVAAYAKQADIPPALGKRRVSLVIALKGRQKKVDPLAYCKSCLDALVACRMLVDDTAQFVEWGGLRYSDEQDVGTTIVLEDLE